VNENRNNWFLLTGIVIGLVLGVLYSLVINPVTYVDAGPDSLSQANQDHYRLMVALAYRANGDLGRAQARLRLFDDDNPAYTLGAQAQRSLANGGDADMARALAQLAADFNNPLPVAVVAATSTPGVTLTPPEVQMLEETPTPEVTATPLITFTPRATLRSLPTLAAPFDLRQREIVCGPANPEGLLQIEAVDGNGDPLAGVQIQITWSDGEDLFYTGLYPRISPGYADFQMEPEIVYSLRVGEAGETVTGLYASPCEDGEGDAYWGGWLLRFGQ
jgi:hypothetical protein